MVLLKLEGTARKLINGPVATYLDHAGTTLYPKSLIDAFSADMVSSLLGNPHSASTSSQLSTRRIEDVRLRALQFFNADPDEFDLIFVANATAGIKMVMEGFREQEEGFWYGYHRDSHTSLVGVREAAIGGHHCFESDIEVEKWLEGGSNAELIQHNSSRRLFAYPAQSNMNGRRLPLSWTERLRSSTHGKHVYSLLDAAALVSTSPLDLSNASIGPDFVVISFYKIFGFPDLGALIVRKTSAKVLQGRKYFGGGTVEVVTCGKESWHVRKDESLHEQLEDGTLPIHSIIALDSALRIHEKCFGSLARVSSHTSYLAEQMYNSLATLRHANGRPVCTIYKDPASMYTDSQTQGPIIAFNLQDESGEFLGNTEVEKLAIVQDIHLRSGGLCSPGGIASSLGLQPWEMKRNFSAGHRCGNTNDIIGGRPTGVLRVSLGAMSIMRDVTSFIDFIKEFFVSFKPVQQEVQVAARSEIHLYVESLVVYPIKSCGGWPIPHDVIWDVREEGLAWDREWCLVHQGTRVALSQKKYPNMALFRPSLDLKNGLLRVRYHGLHPSPSSTPDEITVPLSADPTLFQLPDDEMSQSFYQVCGDRIIAQTYSSRDIANFFTDLVGTPCTLARFPPADSGSSTRHSKAHLTSSSTGSDFAPADIRLRPILLSNESPILTILRSSLNRLNEQIKIKEGKAAHASVFRANIVLAEDLASSPGREQPYVEDEWCSLCIGEHIKLDVLGGCRRCQMICLDQSTAEKNEEPFSTLAKTRRKGGKIYFGVHTALAVPQFGQTRGIRIGDRVRSISTKNQS